VGLDRLRHVARQEGNLLEFSFRLWHGGRVGAKAWRLA
jgi:hypothetical protein